jgi:hypothetical protein
MQGIEECSICYCILHTNNELPKRTCRTCKKKFHDACLVSIECEGRTSRRRAYRFSFVGFDPPISRPVHIAVQTFNSFIFSLYFIVFNVYHLFFDMNVSFENCSRKQKKHPETKIFFSYRSPMSTDKAKESAAIAAVNEQINSVGRQADDDRKTTTACLERTYHWRRIRFNYCAGSEKNWYALGNRRIVYLFDTSS